MALTLWVILILLRDEEIAVMPEEIRTWEIKGLQWRREKPGGMANWRGWSSSKTSPNILQISHSPLWPAARCLTAQSQIKQTWWHWLLGAALKWEWHGTYLLRCCRNDFESPAGTIVAAAGGKLLSVHWMKWHFHSPIEKHSGTLELKTNKETETCSRTKLTPACHTALEYHPHFRERKDDYQ